MQKEYNHLKIEKKWQKEWEKKKIYEASNKSKKKKFYGLIEFPYPSGAGLHVGHIRSNTAMDIISRKRRMQGFNVLYPIGWDAFGLPTENYAIKTGIHPGKVTKQNTDTFRKQLKSIGFSFDWAREVNTTDPQYYKWTQWIFLQFFKKGLAYKKKIEINWCISCKIGLANEEVVGGMCERCGGPVVKKEKEQWMLAITKYADRLDKDLDTVNYLEKIKTQQRNWIGKSEGLIFSTKVKDSDIVIDTFSAHFEACYADTFFAIAPDHPLLLRLLEKINNKEEILKKANEITEKRNKLGDEYKDVEGIFTGCYGVDPLGNGDLPIWIASFALKDYGTGIVKCSAHDERDFIFAKKYGIKLKAVIFPEDEVLKKQVKNFEICFSDMQNGILNEPLEFKGKKGGENRQEIALFLEKNNFAKRKTTYKLRDWVFSRQRYWGEPIPLINCKDCGWVSVPEKDLPVVLPKVKSYTPTDNGESPLANISKWINVKCPQCKKPAKRETDTMPNWAGSSWYYLRYVDPKNKKEFASKKNLKYFTPVDWYNGGMEHTTLHLLYSRFWHKFLYDLKLVPTKEPYTKRTSHGMILANGGEKMSKSKGNTVNPDDLVKTYGADTLRIYEMFMGPFDQVVSWNTDSMIGPRRFLERVWRIIPKVKNIKSQNKEFKILLNKTIKKVSEDIENMYFNTSISSMMILFSEMEKLESVSLEDYKKSLQILAPFAPHIAEEIWRILGEKKSIHLSPWPKFNPKFLIDDEIKIVIQVNGKVRGEIFVNPDINEEDLKSLIFKREEIAKHISNQEIKKFIYIKGRLVSIVV
ncbi:MAG: leucine--tRNA ligase [Candidatus Pacebacteria bacterium]|nr:leucine--tRNA ligase [Candidatus Paceibacterota bacterium]